MMKRMNFFAAVSAGKEEEAHGGGRRKGAEGDQGQRGRTFDLHAVDLENAEHHEKGRGDSAPDEPPDGKRGLRRRVHGRVFHGSRSSNLSKPNPVPGGGAICGPR